MTEIHPAIRAGLVAPNSAGEITLIYPSTGRSIVLSDATDADLAGFVDDVDEWRSRATEAQALARAELLRRMDSATRWTMHAGGFKVSAPSPSPIRSVDDPAALRDELRALATNEIMREVIDEAVPLHMPAPYVTANLPALDRLRKLGGEVKAAIERHIVETPREQRPVRIARTS